MVRGRMQLRGSVCLVTGASSGIGRAACVALAHRGARVIASGRDEAALRDVAAATGAIPIAADLRGSDGAELLAGEAEAATGGVDVLINDAGIGWGGPFEDMPTGRAEDLIAVNLAAPIALARALIPGMLERRRGWIANVASIAGHVGVRDEAVYSATKAALIAFGEALRHELDGRGVGVTTLTPGVVRTAFFERRGRPYERSRPRPIPPERVADALVRGIERGAADVFVPGWLGGVARLRGAAPGAFRALARRFG